MLSILLLAIPAASALIIWLLKGNSKILSLVSSLATLSLALYTIFNFNPGAGFQQNYSQSWISGLNINFALGIDGISAILILLTAVAIPLILLASFEKTINNPSLFYSLILFMQAALMGVFLAKDIFLFYFFFEVTLIPIYFICAVWGGPNRVAATFKFFVYTIFGSLFMLLALVYLYFQTPGEHSAAIVDLYNLTLTSTQQGVLFAAIFLAFAIKMPLFPFHTWQPDTYVEAPTEGSMLLSGIMLKMGTYGVIRILLPILPVASAQWGWVAGVLSIIGIIYGSIIAIQQNQIKRLIAYSSFAHVGLMAAGIFTKSLDGIQGSLVQMFAHGINVIGLFFVADILYRRTKTDQLTDLGGLTSKARTFTICFIIIMLGSVALPLTNGFVGEFLLLKSLFDLNWVFGAVAGLTIILGAVYMLRLVQKSIFGPDSSYTATFTDLVWSEKIGLGLVVAMVLVFGIMPNAILQLSEPAVNQLLNLINR